MHSQLELLKARLAKLEPQRGPDNVVIKSMKAQIARLEKPPADNPVVNRK